MTDLDKAFEALRAKPDDQKAQSGFYDLFLNTLFFVPTAKEMIQVDEEGTEQETEVPLIIENEGTDYLVFFDQQQRLNDWAEQDAPFVKLPGHLLVEMTTADLNWVMNLGTDHFKPFAPDEIAWLKEVVAHCKAEDAGADSK
jgi:peptidyl-prolyl cis-trans isomerase C